MLSNITFYDFCSVWSVAVNTLDKLVFLAYIYIILSAIYDCLIASADIWDAASKSICINSTIMANIVIRLLLSIKGKGISHTRYQTLGPELIPVYRQSARRCLLAIHSPVGCHYFPPGLQLHPSRPRIRRYQIILLRDRGSCVWAACPRLLPGSGPAEIRTHDLLDREWTLYRYATRATMKEGFLARDVIYTSRISRFCYDVSVHLSVCLWRKCIGAL